MSWSAVVMLLSAERSTSKLAGMVVVPWLHTVTDRLPVAPGASDGGPLTPEITRSGWLPMPIRLPVRALFVSISSHWLLNVSTVAPTNQIPPGEKEAFITRSRHSPADRNEAG